MATDFSYGNKTINSLGPIKPSGTNQPLDPRTEVKLYADIKTIPNPYVGMIITVLEDETNQNKMTDYKVLSLKPNSLGIANSVIDQVQRYVDYLGVTTGGGTGLTPEQEAKLNSINDKVDKVEGKTLTTNDYTNEEKQTVASLKATVGDTSSGLVKDVKDLKTNGVSQDNINVAIENYLQEHPVQSGATTEQANQIEANRTAIGDANSGLIKEVNDIKNNAFKDKVANFLGDSQTERNFHKSKTYHDWVKEILGLSKVNNYGVGGTTITKKSASDNTAMCVRYASMDDNADLICVMGGVNDRWFNSQMGNFGDTDPLTFYGAMETLCDGLLNKYPGKTIIFITPTEQNNGNCNSANTTGYTATDFANAMKRVCAKYSIPVFDANTCSGIYPLNRANGAMYTSDRLHLNDKGHEVLGNKLSKFILNGANVVMINNDSSGGSTSETYGNIVVSKSATTINEGGTDTFTVKLDKAPTNAQTVNISSNNTDVTLSTSTLTFNSSNYNQTQEVRINVAEDSDTTNDSCTLTLSSNNVPSKTITITVTDNDTPSETPPETPGENQFIGKTVTVTKNYENNNFAHLTALLNVDEDMKDTLTYNIVLNGSNASNMANAQNYGGTVFSDNSGEVSNGLRVGTVSGSATFTQTVSNGNLTITATPRNGAVSTNYVKVPIILNGTIPYSFRIDEIKIIVNNVERNILKLGAFFASDKEIVTVE